MTLRQPVQQSPAEDTTGLFVPFCRRQVKPAGSELLTDVRGRARRTTPMTEASAATAASMWDIVASLTRPEFVP